MDKQIVKDGLQRIAKHHKIEPNRLFIKVDTVEEAKKLEEVFQLEFGNMEAQAAMVRYLLHIEQINRFYTFIERVGSFGIFIKNHLIFLCL